MSPEAGRFRRSTDHRDARVQGFAICAADAAPTTPVGITARCAGLKATIAGIARPDTLRGTAGPDVIAGLGGNDAISGLGGNDIVCGGGGNDTIAGGLGTTGSTASPATTP